MNQSMLRLTTFIVLGGSIFPLLSCGDQGAGSHVATPDSAAEGGRVKGPHGGRLLAEGDFQVEVTIFERGVPPEFRVYTYEAKKPVDLSEVKLSIEVHRLGGRVDKVSFKKEGDFLRGDLVVYEPHSFEVKVSAEWKGKTYRMQYAQVEARTEMSPEAAKAGGVEVEEAGLAKMKSILELQGEIILNPDRIAHIVPRFDAVVTEVRKSLGDKVARGEVVAVIDSKELASAKLDYILAVHKLEFAQLSFDREERLWKKKITPEEDYLKRKQDLEESKIGVRSAEQKLRALGIAAGEVKALAESHADNQDNLARYEVRAPLDGVVIEKDIVLGEAVKNDTEIFAIADLSTVLAKLTVHAKDLTSVKVGQSLTLKSDALGSEVSGTVAYLGPLIGAETRTAQALVKVPNPEGVWRPGLFVAIDLVREEFTVPVAVRADAIQKFRDWDVVFIQDGNLYEAVSLELGRREGEWVEILSGLPAGMKYVTKNSFLIKADILKSGATHDH